MPARRLETGTRAGLSALVLLALLAGAGRGLAAGNGWSLILSPTTIPAATTATIKAAITNQGGSDGTHELGCVRISIPLTFSIKSATVTSRPSNTKWAASIGIGSVTIAAPSGGDRLPPDGTTAVTVALSVLALTPGTYTWAANAYRQGDCTDGYNEPISLKVVVQLDILPLPTPTALPTILPSILPSLLPTPHPTATPAPVPTATPAPTKTPAPAGTPVATAAPDGGGGGTAGPTPSPRPASARPTGAPSDDPPDAGPSAAPPLGAALGFPGGGPDDGSTGAGEPSINLTSGFETPFGDGFEWAVPGLVLSVPGLLIVLIAVGAQAFGAAAWLPVVRRRIGGSELDRRREGPSRGADTSA